MGVVMGIPNFRIDESKVMQKAKVRNRRKHARTKDWQRKHTSGEYNFHSHPEYHVRKQWWIHFDYAEWELEKKHVKIEKKLAKHSRIDYV